MTIAYGIKKANGWVWVAEGNLTRMREVSSAIRKIELIAVAKYHLGKAETELKEAILAEAALKELEAIETYTLPVICVNCGYRFTFTIVKGMAVRGGITGTLEKRQVFSPWTRERIYCPNCGGDRLRKEE